MARAEGGKPASFSISLSAGQPVHENALPAGHDGEPDGGLEAILQNVQASLDQTRDIEQILAMEIHQPARGTTTRAEGRVLAILPGLFRLDFLSPDMLAGISVVVDLAANEVRQFQPVTEQVIVQAWDQLARERSFELELEHWFGVPDPQRFALKRVADQQIGGTRYIVLDGTAKQPSAAARYEFLINPERWWVDGLRLFDADGQLLFSAWVTDITFNQGLGEGQLRALPPGAEVVYR